MKDIDSELYLQPKEKIYIKPDLPIKVGDICEIMGEKILTENIKKIELVHGPYNRNLFVITLLSVIKQIKNKYPNITINILSERDVLIEIDNSSMNQNKILKLIKLILVCIILFIGAGITIMNFHADVNMDEVHKNFYELITGDRVEHPLWISIPYSIGIGLGMIVFFSHISAKKRKSNQPSPLDLEIYSYQNSLDDFIRNKSKERKN